MSMNSKGLAYFTDGHTEAITDFEISKDGHNVWFTTESGRWFLYEEELARSDKGWYYPDYKFYKVQIDRDYDEFGSKCDVQYLVTDEIEKFEVCVTG